MTESNTFSELRYASDPDPRIAEASRHRLQLSPPNSQLSFDDRCKEIMRLAEQAFSQTGNWVVFYRELLGVSGIARKLFATPEDMRAFEERPEFAELQEMVAAMRSQDASKADASEPERMITIRLPKSLHDTLKGEADETNLSINKLCISKLLQRIEARFVPIQQGRRRGRKPGPQGPRKRPESEAQ